MRLMSRVLISPITKHSRVEIERPNKAPTYAGVCTLKPDRPTLPFFLNATFGVKFSDRTGQHMEPDIEYLFETNKSHNPR